MALAAAAAPSGVEGSAPVTVRTSEAASAAASPPLGPKIIPASCGARLRMSGKRAPSMLFSDGGERGLAEAPAFRRARHAAVDNACDRVDDPGVGQDIQVIGGPEPGGAVGSSGRRGCTRNSLLQRPAAV